VGGLFGSDALGFESARVSVSWGMRETLKLLLLGRRPVPLFIAVRLHLVSSYSTYAFSLSPIGAFSRPSVCLTCRNYSHGV
jgi:hypothetical protein